MEGGRVEATTSEQVSEELLLYLWDPYDMASRSVSSGSVWKISTGLKGEWGVEHHPSTPTRLGIRFGGQFLEEVRSVAPTSRDLRLPHRHVWTET